MVPVAPSTYLARLWSPLPVRLVSGRGAKEKPPYIFKRIVVLICDIYTHEAGLHSVGSVGIAEYLVSR